MPVFGKDGLGRRSHAAFGPEHMMSDGTEASGTLRPDRVPPEAASRPPIIYSPVYRVEVTPDLDTSHLAVRIPQYFACAATKRGWRIEVDELFQV
jgi:hypothetical protein